MQVDARPRAGGVVVTVHLRPRVVVTRVDVVGNSLVDDAEVRALLGLGADGELEEGAVRPLHDRLVEAYSERGYPNAEVSIALRDTDDPSRKVLRISIEEGAPLTVARYAYVGDPVPEDVDIPGAVGIGLDAVLDRTRLSDGLLAARRALRAAGYLESRLSGPEVVVTNRQQAVLRFELHLGHRYRVRVVGHDPLERGTVEDVLELEEERLSRPVPSG